MDTKLFAITYLFLATLGGRVLRKRYLSGQRLLDEAPFFVNWVADFYLGVMPLTTINYFLALILKAWLPKSVYPLLVSNAICFVLVLILLILSFVSKRRSRDTATESSPSLTERYRDGMKQVQTNYRQIGFYLLSIGIFTLWAWFLTAFVLKSQGGMLGAGYSVFSDYAPHTAVVSSFAKGRNFPTEYPHFAGDGVQYHFFFFFLAGNLEYLGMDLASALNLPSALGLIAFCILLGYIAVRWTKRDAAFLLAPMLVFFRSSNAVWHWLADVPSLAKAAGVSIWRYMANNEIFIGRLPNDDWGLWNLNVFANQRHFLFVLGLALLILILFYPTIKKPSLTTWTDPKAWLPEDWRGYLPIFMLMVCLPYWHGSVTVALLLMLAWFALFGRDKLAYLATALIAISFALIYGKLFSGETAANVSPSFKWGFITEDKSLLGVLSYLWELLGLALPAILILPFLQASKRKRVLAVSILFPLLFSLTISLTPDVTVNHKYIMISQMFATVLTADLILRFLRLSLPEKRRYVGPIVAAALTLVLGASGIVDLITYKNKNMHVYAIPEHSAFQTWIEAETEPEDIFLTGPWHYHPFFLTGRKVWYGHAYYAWSAGHDTAKREDEVRQLFAGTEDPKLFVDYCLQNGIRYAILTDDLRLHPDYNLNEAFFQANFELVAEFPEQNNAVIYRIYR